MLLVTGAGRFINGAAIVVDCINPLGMVDGALGLTIGHTCSGGELVQSWLPKARVVKTLNQIGSETMADASALALARCSSSPAKMRRRRRRSPPFSSISASSRWTPEALSRRACSSPSPWCESTRR